MHSSKQEAVYCPLRAGAAPSSARTLTHESHGAERRRKYNGGARAQSVYVRNPHFKRAANGSVEGFSRRCDWRLNLQSSDRFLPSPTQTLSAAQQAAVAEEESTARAVRQKRVCVYPKRW